MHTVESTALTDRQHLLTRSLHPGIAVTLNCGDQVRWNVDIGDRPRQVPGHGSAGQHHYPGVDRPRHLHALAPPQQALQRVADLREHEICPGLPGRDRPQAARHPGPERRKPAEHRIPRDGPGLLDHCLYGQFTGTTANTGLVTVDVQERVHAVRGRRQQIPTKPQQVPVPRIQAGNPASTHRLHLVGYRHTRHRRPPDVVVGNQERVSHMAEDTDLVPDPCQIRASRRLNLADNLKPATRITLTHHAASRSPEGALGDRQPRRGAERGGRIARRSASRPPTSGYRVRAQFSEQIFVTCHNPTAAWGSRVLRLPDVSSARRHLCLRAGPGDSRWGRHG
jgi:hypothetical protein